MLWRPPQKLTPTETRLVKRFRKSSKFFVFLRSIRQRLFNDDFQKQLLTAYKPRGQKPVPPALLAMVCILQAYKKVSDAEAVECATLDLRWKLVLGCLDQPEAPFSQGTLVHFRERMVEHDLDRKLLDQTVALAKETKEFGWQALKAAFDSSPLKGAGRVEDTWNLIGRALKQLVGASAKALGLETEECCQLAGLELLGGSSLKRTLDLDWDCQQQRQEGLQRLVEEADKLKAWVDKQHFGEADKTKVEVALDCLAKIQGQDLKRTDQGIELRQGVSKERMPSLGDPQMRHGRKSRSHRFTGYKRQVVRLLGEDLILEAFAVAGNRPDHESAEALLAGAERHGELEELHCDRGYLASEQLASRVEGGAELFCKAWPARNRGLYSKADFKIDMESRTAVCPAGVELSFREGSKRLQFPAKACGSCNVREKCTKAAMGRGRSVGLHKHEALLQELRRKQKSKEGREGLRARTVVEHSLGRLGRIQGDKARYKGRRKNTLDVRRAAVVNNLHTLRRLGLEGLARCAA